MTPPTRDRAVDVIRLAALVVVMFGHCALLLATVDSGGVRIANLIGAVPAVAPATWLAQVMPLFFLAGGAAGAYGYRAGTAWGAWVFARAQRLFRPVFWYLAAWTVGLAATWVVLGADSAADLGAESVALLWFLGVYVVTLAFVPALVRLGSGRALAAVLAVLITAAAATDAFRLGTGELAAGLPNFLFVWLIPIVIGVGYARGLIRPGHAAVTAAAAFAAALVLVTAGPYEVSLVVTGAERISNVSPPTLLLALHCVWMSCAFVALSGPIGRWAQHTRLWGVIAAGNAGAMTLYLWHIVAIAIAAFALNAFGLDAYDVHAGDFVGMLLLRAAVFAVVMLALFRLLSPLERRPLPWWDTTVTATGRRATTAGALVCAAGVVLVVMAKFGLGDPTGWAACAAFLSAAAAARLFAAAPLRIRAAATLNS
ncbi:acetyltransferase [Mycobacterium sp. EPG1]|nr:acetyltransferase [Mycobacterium sp. EPG1]